MARVVMTLAGSTTTAQEAGSFAVGDEAVADGDRCGHDGECSPVAGDDRPGGRVPDRCGGARRDAATSLGAQVAADFGAGSTSRPCRIEVDQVDGTPRYPVQTFDPLLRDLVTWGLVSRAEPDELGPDEFGRDTWRLSPVAQDRLSELVAGAVVPVPERLVYFDHLCARCHLRGPTRLHGGAYLCAPCLEEERAEAVRTELPDATSRRRRLSRRRRRSGVEETGPLAS